MIKKQVLTFLNRQKKIIVGLLILPFLIFLFSTDKWAIIFYLSCVLGFIILIGYNVLWKSYTSYYFAQFNNWRFQFLSNLLYDYKIEDTTIFTIPEYFRKFMPVDQFIAQFEKRKGKCEIEKRVSYEFLNYRLINKIDRKKYFNIGVLKFSKVSFLFLLIPPSLKEADLIDMGIKLPVFYSSKIPLPFNLLLKRMGPSEIIMSNYFYDYSRTPFFVDINEVELAQLEKEIKEIHKFQKLENIEGFEKFQNIFDHPIIEKSKDGFVTKHFIDEFCEKHRLIGLPSYLTEDIILNLLSFLFYRGYPLHIQDQVFFLLEYYKFLDWLKANSLAFEPEELQNFKKLFQDIKYDLQKSVEAEQELNNILYIKQRVKPNFTIEETMRNPFPVQIELRKMMINYLSYFINYLQGILSNIESKLIDDYIKKKTLNLQENLISSSYNIVHEYSDLLRERWTAIKQLFRPYQNLKLDLDICKILKILLDYKRKTEKTEHWKVTSKFKLEKDFQNDLYDHFTREGLYPNSTYQYDEVTKGKSDLLIKNHLVELKFFKKKIDFDEQIEEHKLQIKQLTIDREKDVGFLVIMDNSPQKKESTQNKKNEIKPVLIFGGRNIRPENDPHPIGIICLLINGGLLSSRSTIQK